MLELGAIGSVLAYDRRGVVCSTLHWLVHETPEGERFIVDFNRAEREGRLQEFYRDPEAVGMGTWPQYLRDIREYRVELGPDRRITAIIHRKTNTRFGRDEIYAELERRLRESDGPINATDLLGGPFRPLAFVEGRLVASAPETAEAAV